MSKITRFFWIGWVWVWWRLIFKLKFHWTGLYKPTLYNICLCKASFVKGNHCSKKWLIWKGVYSSDRKISDSVLASDEILISAIFIAFGIHQHFGMNPLPKFWFFDEKFNWFFNWFLTYISVSGLGFGSTEIKISAKFRFRSFTSLQWTFCSRSLSA